MVQEEEQQEEEQEVVQELEHAAVAAQGGDLPINADFWPHTSVFQPLHLLKDLEDEHEDAEAPSDAGPSSSRPTSTNIPPVWARARWLIWHFVGDDSVAKLIGVNKNELSLFEAASTRFVEWAALRRARGLPLVSNPLAMTFI